MIDRTLMASQGVHQFALYCPQVHGIVTTSRSEVFTIWAEDDMMDIILMSTQAVYLSWLRESLS